MRICLLDIETAPNLVHVWRLFQQNVAINQIMEAGYVLSVAWKWYGEEETFFESVRNKRRMLKKIHKALDEADVVVHFNGITFDIPHLNKEFLMAGMLPPSPYKQVDLKMVVQRQFNFASSKLDFVCQQLGIGKKVEHEGHPLWVKVMEGDKEAWAKMEEYNRYDVVGLLEPLYTKLLPWIPNHPSHGVYVGRPVCTNCGSEKVQARGYQRTNVNEYKRYQCQGCGKWLQDAVHASLRSAAQRRATLRHAN